MNAALQPDAAERLAASELAGSASVRLRGLADVRGARRCRRRQLEEWRYTDVSAAVKLDKVTLADALPTIAELCRLRGARAMLDGRDASGRVVLVDGCVVEATLDQELRAKGVLLLDLRGRRRAHPDLVREHLGTRRLPRDFNKFAALNGALWTGGVFLYVPRGVRIEQPIRVARWISRSGHRGLPAHADRRRAEGSHVGFVDELRLARLRPSRRSRAARSK